VQQRDLNGGVLWVGTFLFAFGGFSYRSAGMVGAVVEMGRRTRRGSYAHTLVFHNP